MNFIRRRLWLWVMVAAVLAAMFLTDPDQGASTQTMLLGLVSGVLAVACAHVAMKVMFDYREADRRSLFRKVQEGSLAAALALIAQAIIFVGLLFVFAPRAHADTLPPGAVKYLPTLRAEQMRLWPNHPAPSVLAALIEQETCPSLKHAQCWSPTARLKTSREEGAGFGQLTRAYDSTGALRFDTLDTVRQLDPSLAPLTWSTIYSSPDLQLRAVVAMNRSCYARVSSLGIGSTEARLAFCDAAYNGGYGGMQSERRACHMAADCDAGQWFGNVERYCLKSKTKWQGYGASACDINRTHVRNVMQVRRAKYEPHFGSM